MVTGANRNDRAPATISHRSGNRTLAPKAMLSDTMLWCLFWVAIVILNLLGWVVVLAPALLIFLPFWGICRLRVWIRYGKHRRQFTGIESAFIHEEETSRSTVAVFSVLTGEHDPDVVHRYDRKLMVAKKEYPDLAFLSCPERIHSYYYWKEKQEFKFADHWILLDGVNPDRLYSETEIFELYGDRTHNSPFPDGLPMWQVYYVPRFVFDHEVGKPDAVEKSCYILRAHHSICDGISMGKFMNRFMLDNTFDYNPIPPLPYIPPWKMFLLHAAAIYNIPWVTSPMLFRRLWNWTRLPPLNGRKIICTLSVDIEMVRFIKRKAGCYFSEVIVSSVGATLQDFFSKQAFCPGVIRSVLTLAFPSNDDAIITNNFALVTIPFSGKNLDPLQRLRDTQKMVQKMKKSIDVLSFYWFLKIMGYLLPSAVYGRMIRFLDAFAVVSYVPGRGPVLYHQGRAVADGHFIAQHRDRTGITITAITYLNVIRINFLVDGGLVKGREDVQRMADVFQEKTLQLAKMLGYDEEKDKKV